MHMPTGQSGHPLSPFYANSHDAWVKGEPTPFLPGPSGAYADARSVGAPGSGFRPPSPTALQFRTAGL